MTRNTKSFSYNKNYPTRSSNKKPLNNTPTNNKSSNNTLSNNILQSSSIMNTVKDAVIYSTVFNGTSRIMDSIFGNRKVDIISNNNNDNNDNND
jgi:hypothetical protein